MLTNGNGDTHTAANNGAMPDSYTVNVNGKVNGFGDDDDNVLDVKPTSNFLEEDHHSMEKKERDDGDKINVDDDFQHNRFDERKLEAKMASTGSIFLVARSLNNLDELGDEVGANNICSKSTANGNSVNASASSNKNNKDSLWCSLLKIMDFTVLANYITLFYTVVSFCCFFGYFNYVLYLPSVVMEKGFTRYDKAILISICGAGDLIARLAVGFLADRNFIARYKIKAMACLLCAVTIMLFLVVDSFAGLAILSFLYGFLGGGYVCMVAVVLVDFVGLASMSKNLAVVLFIQGIGSSSSQPLLGRSVLVVFRVAYFSSVCINILQNDFHFKIPQPQCNFCVLRL